MGGDGGGGGGGGDEFDGMDAALAGNLYDAQTTSAQDLDISGHSFNFANSTLGTLLGETKSDQEIAEDRAVEDALNAGRTTFIDPFSGETRNFGEGRYSSPPTPGSPLDFGRTAGLGLLSTAATIASAATGLGPAAKVAAAAADRVLGTPDLVTIGTNKSGEGVLSSPALNAITSSTQAAPASNINLDDPNVDLTEPLNDVLNTPALENSLEVAMAPTEGQMRAALTENEGPGPSLAEDISIGLSDLTTAITNFPQSLMEGFREGFINPEDELPEENIPEGLDEGNNGSLPRRRRPDSLITASSTSLVSEELDDPLAESRRILRSQNSLLSGGARGFV